MQAASLRKTARTLWRREVVVRDKPYVNIHQPDGSFERTFEDAEEMELVWHRDREDRTVVPVSGDGWMLQMENCLPVPLERDKKYFIQKGVYHRLIRGSTPLVINIREN